MDKSIMDAILPRNESDCPIAIQDRLCPSLPDEVSLSRMHGNREIASTAKNRLLISRKISNFLKSTHPLRVTAPLH
jgi:hypothetical protein